MHEVKANNIVRPLHTPCTSIYENTNYISQRHPRRRYQSARVRPLLSVGDRHFRPATSMALHRFIRGVSSPHDAVSR